MRDLFDRWERVWQEGHNDLVPSCVEENYIRHDEGGDRTVTRETYAADIAKTREERLNIRVVVYDHSFEGDRAWFRFAFKWPDPKTSEPRSRAGMQSYRIASLVTDVLLTPVRQGMVAQKMKDAGALGAVKRVRINRRSGEMEAAQAAPPRLGKLGRETRKGAAFMSQPARSSLMVAVKII